MNTEFFLSKGWKFLVENEGWYYFTSEYVDRTRYMLIWKKPFMYVYYQTQVEGGVKSEEIFGGRCMSEWLYDIISQTIGIDKI